MYILKWRNTTLDANKAAEIQVGPGVVVSNKASIIFTGKGTANYGKIQQENMMRLLENFADGDPPLYPTVGQQWFDTTSGALKICSSIANGGVWRSIGGVQATSAAEGPPVPASVGDLWAQRRGAGSGAFFTYTGFGRHPTSGPNQGGWEQIWPTVETIAGREEYDEVKKLVDQLVGPASEGGNGALGTIIPALPDLDAMDVAYREKFAQLAELDPNMLVPVDDDTDELKVSVISSDWDHLLAAARFAVSRLDLPPDMVQDISPMPFVSDGLQVSPWLSDLPTTSVMYPTLERRSNRRFGTVTLVRAFTETFNVLNAAIANRYSLKGMNGATGANPTMEPNTVVLPHASFSGAADSNTGGTLTLRFNFGSVADLQSFINSGGALQLTASHTNSGVNTTGDVDFKTLVDSRGVLRLTADKTRVFANTASPALSVAPSSVGLKNADGGSTVLTTQTASGATYTVSVTQPTDTQLSITFDFNSTGAMNGTITLNWQVIRDNTTYIAEDGGEFNAFSAPLTFMSADKTAGSVWLLPS